MKKIGAICLAAGLVLNLAACGGEQQTEEPASRQIYAMDTVMQVSAYGEHGETAVDTVEQELYDLEDLLSRTREKSWVWKLNHGETLTMEGDLAELLVRAEHYTRETGGAFDVTIAPVAEAWGFTTDTRQVPDPDALAELLTHVGMEHVHMSDGTVSLDPGTEIDLGGIAKGYASDRVAEIYEEQQVPRGMVYLGGNVLAWGDRPNGEPWRIGIQDPDAPEDPDALVGILHLRDAFAITSGGYQRYFEEDGRRYHHIIDPATGYPSDSGLTSVTVVADKTYGNGTMCDALSTALFVLGEEQALDFWRRSDLDFDLVLVTEDDRVLVTEGLTDRFKDVEGSGYSYETVS